MWIYTVCILMLVYTVSVCLGLTITKFRNITTAHNLKFDYAKSFLSIELLFSELNKMSFKDAERLHQIKGTKKLFS